MKKQIYKLLVSISILFITMVLSTQVKAESLTVNKKTVTVGESFTVTFSGINGFVSVSSNDKVTLSKTGKIWIDDTLTISGTAKTVGTGNVTINLLDVSTTSAEPKELTGNRSINITIKEKEIPKTETKSETNTKPETTTKPESNKTTTTKTESKNTETKKVTSTKVTVPTEEKEEATPQWGINSVKVIGVKENGEKVDIELDKKFDISTYEYSCNVSADIKKVEIEQEAYEYNEFVTISGLEEDLKLGENIITLKLSKEGKNDLTYTIKVNKEEMQEETKSVSAEVEKIKEEKEETIIVEMPLWSFILILIVTIVVTSAISILITKKVLENKKTDKPLKDEFEELK